jgi:hypothetical protein
MEVVMMTRRATVTVAVVLTALFGLACKEGKSPTEPAAIVATPTPGPAQTPTPVPQPASMSGKVSSYGPLLSPTTVLCQGKLATAAADGSYSLSGLLSGQTMATVTYTYVTNSGVTATDSENFLFILNPGANTMDFRVY